MVPYLIVTTGSMPQATLLYWASNSAFFLGLQKALEAPRIAAALKVPTPMLPPPQQAKEARGGRGGAREGWWGCWWEWCC